MMTMGPIRKMKPSAQMSRRHQYQTCWLRVALTGTVIGQPNLKPPPRTRPR